MKKIAIAMMGLMVAAWAAQGALVIELNFEDAGANIGDNLTSTANTGTAGGTATGTAFNNGTLTYTADPTAARRRCLPTRTRVRARPTKAG